MKLQRRLWGTVGLALVASSCGVQLDLTSTVSLRNPQPPPAAVEEKSNLPSEQEIFVWPSVPPAPSLPVPIQLEPGPAAPESPLPANTTRESLLPEDLFAGIFKATPPPKDISVAHNTTLNGTVYDGDDFPVEDARVTVESVTDGVDFKVHAMTRQGVYVFNDVPSGILLSLKVEKEGSRTSEQMVVLKSNTPGDPRANKIDFGGPSPESRPFFLNAGPEIIEAAPVSGTRISPASLNGVSFKFSKPVIKSSVEAALRISSAKALNTFGPLLGADETVYLGTTDAGFQFSWNKEQTEMTATFQELPTVAAFQETMPYRVSFAQPFQGTDRSQAHVGQALDAGFTKGPFYLDQTRKAWIELEVTADILPPQIQQLDHKSNQIELKMSEKIHFVLGSPKRNLNNPNLTANANYILRIDTNKDGTLDLDKQPGSVSVNGDIITLSFDDLGALTGLTANLVVMNKAAITDVAGNPLMIKGPMRLVL